MKPFGSSYLAWARQQPQPPFALTASGMPSRALAELGVDANTLRLTLGGSGWGWPPLARALAHHYGVDPDGVVLANGTTMANHLAMAALLAPGDEVLIEQPAYEALPALARQLGATVTRFGRAPERDFDVDVDAVAAAVTPRTRLIVLTQLHNPSGVAVDEPTLRRLGQLAAAHHAHLLVDEAYRDALGDESRPAATLGPQYIVTSSLTKLYGLAGLRCGFVFCAPELARRIERLDDLYANNLPALTAQLALAALPHLPAWRDQARRLLAAHHRLVAQFLDGQPRLQTTRAPAGTTLFPRLVDGDVDALYQRLLARGASVVPGRLFEAPQHFRLGLSVPTAQLQGGLERLAAALAA